MILDFVQFNIAVRQLELYWLVLKSPLRGRKT